jgi:CubicO group peptidase (beta-lactamase class C family)
MSDLTRRSLLIGGVTGVSLAAAPLALAARPGHRKKDAPWIPSDEFMEAELPLLMRLENLPGVSIAVVDEGKVIWSRAFGVTNIDTKEMVRADTPFEAASMGKPAFIYVAMKLVEEGLLHLDRPLVSYMPRPAFLAADDPQLDKVTVLDVMRHSTGLPNWVDRPNADTGIVPLARTSFVPGSRFGYSGTAMFWLQIVAETVSGMPFGRLMQSRLFEPAGMSSATYGWTEERAKVCAYSHNQDYDPRIDDRVAIIDPKQIVRSHGDPLLPVAKRLGKPIIDWKYGDMLRYSAEAHPFDPLAGVPLGLIPNAAYSLTITASDYAKLLILMMDGRAASGWEISAQSRRDMLTTRTNIRGHLDWIGLGWRVENNLGGGILYGHSGSNDSSWSDSLADPRGRRGVVVMANGMNGLDVCCRVVREATGLNPFSLYSV